MKHIFLILFIASTLPSFAQQDSIVYKKLKNGGSITITIDIPKSDTYLSDSLFYKLKFSKTGEIIDIRIESFTDIDTLMKNVLYSEFVDASRQYKNAILNNEAEEGGYELRLRQAERQYETFAKEPIKERIEKDFDPKELIGDWELNGEPVKIDEKLFLDGQPIKILSDQQFVVQINEGQLTFNRIKSDQWVAKGGKYTLARPKSKGKSKKK